MAKSDDVGVPDGIVGGAMVHWFVGWMLEFPGCLGSFICLDVGGEVRAGGVPWWSWYMRAKRYWFHDWNVGGRVLARLPTMVSAAARNTSVS